jgi:hypothetical protein
MYLICSHNFIRIETLLRVSALKMYRIKEQHIVRYVAVVKLVLTLLMKCISASRGWPIDGWNV